MKETKTVLEGRQDEKIILWNIDIEEETDEAAEEVIDEMALGNIDFDELDLVKMTYVFHD